MQGFTSGMPTGKLKGMIPAKMYDPKTAKRFMDRIQAERQRNTQLRNLAKLEMDYYIGNVLAGSFQSDTYFAVENRVSGVIDQIACRIAETRPTGQSVPVNNEEQERAAASARDELITSEFSRVGIYTELTYLIAQQAATTGAAYIGVHWDTTAGSKYTPSPDDQVLLQQYGALKEAGDDSCHLPPYLDGSRGEYKTGGIDVYALDQFEFGYDPYANSLERSTWCYWRYLPMKEEADARWPWAKGQLTTEMTVSDEYSAPDDGSKMMYAPSDRCLVYVYYERSGPIWPNGCVAYLTRTGYLLELHDQLPFDTLPFWEIRDRPVIRRGPGLGRARDLIPLQRELNNRSQRLKEQMDKAGGINILVPQGSMLNQTFLDETVTAYEYDRTVGRPEQFQMVPNPSQQLRINDVRGAMNEISGLPDFTRGRMPSGISGRTIGLYDAQIASLLGQLARSLGAALEGLAQWTLAAWREYAPPEALIEVAGAGGPLASKRFLKRSITSTRWKIDEGSIVPRNIGFLREQLMAFANTPVFTQAPPKVRRWFVNQMQFPQVGDLVKDTGPAAEYGRGVVEMLLTEQWEWPLTDDADNASVVRDVVMDARFGSLYDTASEKARAMFERYLDWSEWVIGAMTKGGQPGYMLRQTMIQLNGDWTQPPPPPGAPPAPPGAPPQQAPPQAPPTDVYGPDPAPSGELPPQLPPELMAMMTQGPGADNAPKMMAPGQIGGPGNEAI